QPVTALLFLDPTQVREISLYQTPTMCIWLLLLVAIPVMVTNIILIILANIWLYSPPVKYMSLKFLLAYNPRKYMCTLTTTTTVTFRLMKKSIPIQEL